MNLLYLQTISLPAQLRTRTESESGYAVVVIQGDEPVDFAYIRAMVPEFQGDGAGDGNWGRAVAALDDSRCFPTLVRFLELGHVHVGILTASDFIPLRRLKGVAATQTQELPHGLHP